jgi:hypothetical protein
MNTKPHFVWFLLSLVHWYSPPHHWSTALLPALIHIRRTRSHSGSRRFVHQHEAAALNEIWHPSEVSRHLYTVGRAILLLPQDAQCFPAKFGRHSAVGSPTLFDAAKHLARKAHFFSNATVEVLVAIVHESGGILVLDQDHGNPDSSPDHGDICVNQSLLQLVPQSESLLLAADALIAISIQQPQDVSFLQTILRKRISMAQDQRLNSKCHLCLDCNLPAPSEMVSTFDSQHASLASHLLTSLPFTKSASARRLYFKMKGLMNRWTSDDFTIALMLFFNQYPTPRFHFVTQDDSVTPQIDWVKHTIDATWEKGIFRNMKEFYTMLSKCGGCIARCFGDSTCRECITKLSTIDTRDQVEVRSIFRASSRLAHGVTC